MTYLMWFVSVPALVIFVTMLITNWHIFYHNYIKKDSAAPVIPLIGGVADMIGLWLIPIWNKNVFWLLAPMIVDWGSIPLLIVTLLSFLLKNR